VNPDKIDSFHSIERAERGIGKLEKPELSILMSARREPHWAE